MYLLYICIDPSFLRLIAAGGEWLASCTGRFTPGGTAPCTNWIGGWVSPRAGLDDVENRKFLTLPVLELLLGTAGSAESRHMLCSFDLDTAIVSKRLLHALVHKHNAFLPAPCKSHWLQMKELMHWSGIHGVPLTECNSHKFCVYVYLGDQAPRVCMYVLIISKASFTARLPFCPLQMTHTPRRLRIQLAAEPDYGAQRYSGGFWSKYHG
jgi:hypothetical protein